MLATDRNAMVVVTVLVPFFVVSTLLGEQPWWVDAALVLAAGLGTLKLFVHVWLRVRRSRGLHPVFRAPVPGEHTATP